MESGENPEEDALLCFCIPAWFSCTHCQYGKGRMQGTVRTTVIKKWLKNLVLILRKLWWTLDIAVHGICTNVKLNFGFKAILKPEMLYA